MHQVSGSELDANLSQLAELVPIEHFEGGFNHGMVYGHVAVAYLNEEEFAAADMEGRNKALRQAYVNCLRAAIDHASALLGEMATVGVTEQYRNAAKQVAASIEMGHDVLDHGPGLEDTYEEEDT